MVKRLFSMHSLIIGLILLVVFYLYFPSLNYFFFQDDWFVFSWVKFSDLNSFFLYRQDTIYYRPLSMPLFFFTFYKIFGLNSPAFHLVSFAIFCLLIISIHRLFLQIASNLKVAYAATFIYATSAIHFISLSWIATTSYIIVTLFISISFSSFITYIESGKKSKYLLSFLTFALAILSHELAITLPLIIFFWGLCFKQKIYLRLLWPYFLITGAYLVFRLFILPLPAEGAYKITLNYLTINNLIWYVFWSFNVPESFKELINQRFLAESARRLMQFGNITLPVILMMLSSGMFVYRNFYLRKRQYIFALFWFLIGLSPVITLTNHSYPLYLSLAGLGFALGLSYSITSISNKVAIAFLITWTIGSIYSLKFTQATHWVNNEQKISRAYYRFSNNLLVKPGSNSAVVFRKPDAPFSNKYDFLISENGQTLKQTLSGDSFAQVIFEDQSLKSYFPEEETIQIPPKTVVFEVNPRGEDDD